MKKIIFSIVVSMFCLLTKVYALEETTFTTDEGAVLNISLSSVGNTATVTGMENITDFKGVLNIPAEIEFQGANYSVVTIGDEAFKGGKMTAVSLGNVTTIGASAFRNSSSLKSIDLTNVKVIGDYAFYIKGSTLKSVVFSGSLQSVGKQIFSSSVSDVTVNVNDITEINGLPIPSFDYSTEVKYYVAGELLKDIIIPEGITNVSGYNQIKGVNTISFPSTVTAISGFSGTTASSVYCYAVTPPELTGLGECYNVPLYVPYKKERAYLMADGFKNFTNIIEMEGEDIPEQGDTIKLSGAGSLAEALSLIEKSEIKNLAIVGKLNAADIKVIRSAADKLATLDTLDISNVELVSSNEAYYTYTTMSDGSMNAIYHRFFISTERRDTFFIQASLSSWPPHYYDHYDYNLTAAFAETKFKRIIMPRTISDIGERTFMSCSNLQEVEMSNAPTSIGKDAFKGCNTLMLIPEMSNVASIGEQAFYNCAQLGMLNGTNSLNLSSVVTIGDNAFEKCKYIASVKCSYNLLSIGQASFSGCTSLVSVKLPANLARLSYDSFDNTPWLTANKELVDGITYLGAVAIESSKNMQTFSFREGTLGIADNFKKNSNKPETLTLPSTLRYIGKHAFNGLPITTIIIPETVEVIGDEAFYACRQLKSINFSASLREIGSSAFYASGLESVVIPESVEEVGRNAFYDSDSLKIVYYGAQHATGTYIFNSCNNVEEVTIGDQVKIIPDGTFSSCEKLEKVTLGSQLEEIGEYAFMSCEILRHIDFPATLCVIGKSAFEKCPLENIVIEENIKELGEYCLASTISMEYNRSTIPENLFSNSKLEAIKLGDNIKIIPSKAFYDCSGLTSITIPNSVTEIGESAFYGTAWYDNQPDGLVYAGKVAYKYKGNMPENTNITLKEGTSSITRNAFSYCYGLTSITIPNSVKSIGINAFGRCTSLTSVTCKAISVPSSGNGVFSYVQLGSAILYVPASALVDYKTTAPWSGFGTIVAIPDSLRGDVNGDDIVNGTDIQAIINAIVEGEYDEKADVNEDGTVNGTDIQKVINIIVEGE